VADDEFTSPGQFASAAETALGEAIAGGYNQVRVYSRSRSVDDDQHDGQYRLAS
jgi:hypothetical protein